MPNRLIREQSPYLLQHAHNPVDWYPWGDEAFERAKKENKPVLVSIGYAACHWCHVMERESFENPVVAAYMNTHFINIKVDREEHPDVDHMYMDAVQAISGSGGWPLNVFVTPDRLPFYGGTYFPPRQAYGRISWSQLLERMNNIWVERNSEALHQGRQMQDYLRNASKIAYSGQGADWTVKSSSDAAANLLQYADTELGGFGRAPKFPATMCISYLLEHYHYTGHKPSLDQAILSLDAMINGGIYDQLGGGLARYATDDKWLVPHFEKMLYDNALLILPLCDAYKLTGNARYKEVAEHIIAFAERELKHPDGGYYSAIDADSEGVEGKFYTWTWTEWNAVLGEHANMLAEYYGVVENGNWEHVNILHRVKDIAVISEEYNLPEDAVKSILLAANEKLFASRDIRVRPVTDDKSLLSWNALMNIALVKAASSFNDDKYLLQAIDHMQWMLSAYLKDKVLKHTWKDGVAKIDAKLDDYAYIIQALLQLGSASEREEYILQACELLEIVQKHFADEGGTFFYFTSAEQEDIPVRKIDLYDGAMPSANAVMAHNLLLAGLCIENTRWIEQAQYMLGYMSANMMRYPSTFAYWGILLQRYAAGLKTAVCKGSSATETHKQLLYYFMPEVFILTSKKEISELKIMLEKPATGGKSVYICTMDACLPPAADAESALKLLNQLK